MVLWIIVPCYNEEEIINDTSKKLETVLEKHITDGMISSNSRVLYVDDGSNDDTWNKIVQINRHYKKHIAIKLSHNQGHQNALYAGMMYAKEFCDCVITIDADLQDDVTVISQFILKYFEGNEIVYGIRNKRTVDSKFKRITARTFYKLMKLLGAETIDNHADYRLLSRKAIEVLSLYREVNLFLRGIVPLIGLKSDYVYYERKERLAGKTKYPLRKMISFAVNGITSFSIKPLRIMSVAGIVFSVLSVLGLLYALISYFCGTTVPGWTAIVCSIWLLGGIQLLGMGLLGEYVGKIFSEVKNRPRYFIEEELK